MTQRAPRAGLFGLSVVFVSACAISVGLGLWQLQRRDVKQTLIAEISVRARAAPTALPDPSAWPNLVPADYEYRRVALEGTFLHDKEVLVFRASGGGSTAAGEPGYLVVTPLRLDSGAIVLVNRGFVPQSALAGGALDRPAEQRPITGLMRAPEPRNLFTPRDDLAQGRAFTRDPVAIAAHFGLDHSAPFSIDEDASVDRPGWPKAGSTELRVLDNHLAYAMTWFGLAAAGAAVFCTFVRRQRQART